MSHPVHPVFSPALVISLLLISCSPITPTASPAAQTSLPATQVLASLAPGNTQPGAAASGTLDPCQLITTVEVTSLLGSAPAPTTGIHANTGAYYCNFQADTGFLEVAAFTASDATAQFAAALASFQTAPSYKKMDSQGASIAFYGGPSTNGSAAQGLIAAMIKGSSLATVKLASKSYSYDVNQATNLLESIAGRLP